MTNNIGFKEKMWGYLWEGVYDPWRVKERVLNETFATLENLPDELKPDIKHHITAPLRDKIRYDDEKKLLFFDGIMTEPECDELKSLSKDKYYIKAIENIREAFLNIKSVKVELSITIKNLDALENNPCATLEGDIEGYVYYEGVAREPLEHLPPEIKPDQLKDKCCKIHYNTNTKLLMLKDVLTKKEKDDLITLSSNNKAYTDAIESLFRKQIIKNGRFKLFSKDPDTHIRRLEYEMPFSVNRQKYFLYGHKEVADDPAKPDLLEILQDLTTCFLTLYKGNSHDDPMLGTGIMEFHTVALPEFVSSLLPETWATDAERSDRRALLEYIVTNLRDTYSTLNYAAPSEFVQEKDIKEIISELDKSWFAISFARELTAPLYRRDNLKEKSDSVTYLLEKSDELKPLVSLALKGKDRWYVKLLLKFLNWLWSQNCNEKRL